MPTARCPRSAAERPSRHPVEALHHRHPPQLRPRPLRPPPRRPRPPPPPPPAARDPRRPPSSRRGRRRRAHPATVAGSHASRNNGAGCRRGPGSDRPARTDRRRSRRVPVPRRDRIVRLGQHPDVRGHEVDVPPERRRARVGPRGGAAEVPGGERKRGQSSLLGRPALSAKTSACGPFKVLPCTCTQYTCVLAPRSHVYLAKYTRVLSRTSHVELSSAVPWSGAVPLTTFDPRRYTRDQLHPTRVRPPHALEEARRCGSVGSPPP